MLIDPMPNQPINNVNLHYRQQGTGPALVLLHGFPHDSRIWDTQLHGLSNRYRVIAPDLPGFGQSKSTEPFTMKSLADDIHALLVELGALPCALGGLSMGGYVALEFVKKYPADLLGLILLDTRAEGDSAQAKEGRNKAIELVKMKGAIGIAEQMVPKQIAPQTLQAQPATASKLRQIMESQSPITIEHALLAMRDRADHSKDLPSIPVPALVIVGSEDGLTPPSLAESINKEIPHSSLAVIQSAGHLSPMEQPREVNSCISDFLQRTIP